MADERDVELQSTWSLPGTIGERHATWLELFFDLVFVASITAVGSRLARQESWTGLLVYMALFIPIWWAWLGHTVYSARFVHTDAIHRALTFVIMLAAAGMTVQLNQITMTGGLAFAASYCLARVALLILYARERCVPQADYLRRLYLRGFGLGAVMWLVSLAVPPPTRYAFWLLGMLIDLVTPWIGRAGLQRTPLNVAHLPERIGLFTLILLGESIVTVVDEVSHVEWGLSPLVVAVLAFGIAICIWWIYFSFVHVARFECTLGSGQPYLYAHLPLALSLTAMAAGIKRAIHEAAAPMLSEPTLMLLGIGSVIWFMSFLLVRTVAYGQPKKSDRVIYPVGGVLALLVCVAGVWLPPLAVFGALAATHLGVAIADWRTVRSPRSLVL